MKRERQSRYVGIRMTPSEVRTLRSRAIELGMSMSDVVRQFVRSIGKKEKKA